MSNTFVFRINYGDEFKTIREEILCGRLRQGWGASGMSIEFTPDQFETAWKNKWGANDSDVESIKRKYNNLRIMKDINVGDIIVIPKLDTTQDVDYPCRCFTVVECTQQYSFSVLEKYSDFGHVIGVSPLFSCSYHSDRLATITISGKFKAYQKAINRVGNSEFLEAVKELIEINKTSPLSSQVEAKDFSFILAQELSEKYDYLVEENLKNLRKMDPKNFEYLIKELFEVNGFVFKRMNYYDKNGGDIDIQMMLNEKSLLGAVFKQAKGADNLYINIQAKKKDGFDWDAMTAAKQLVTKRESNSIPHYIDIVIDLTDDFDEDTEKYAKENHVVLINGKQFSLLLLQFGLTGEIDI